MYNFICPIEGNNVRLTSRFGWRTHPVTGKRNSWHQGVDLAITPNTNVNILASADGVVTRAGVLGTYGYVVIIRHTINGKRMDTTYAHLKAGSIKVKVGQSVKQGQIIGIMGSTGSSTAPHLHFEIHDGAWVTGQKNAVDPMKYISIMSVAKIDNEEELTLSQYTELKKEIEELRKELEKKADYNNTLPVIKDHEETWNWAKNEKLTDGSNPRGALTRMQFFTVLYRFYKKFIKK